MKRVSHIFPIAATVVAICCTLLPGCHHSSPLEDCVREAFVRGDTTEARYDSLCSIVEKNPERYAQYVDIHNRADAAALASLVDRIGQNLRPPMHWNVARYGARSLSLTIFFERSGSMVPYDTPGGGGQLKRAVNNLINFFPGDPNKVEIKIVNDDVYPYNGTVDDFLRDRDIYASTAGTGNAAYTDFAKIFGSVLSRQRAGNVSVIVTDLIYSPADTRDVSLQKIFNEENSLATRVFKNCGDKTVVVYRLLGDYNGRYYPYNNAAFDYHGQRPFFLLLIADTPTYEAMAANADFARFLAPEGTVGTYRFNQSERDVDFCALPDWPTNAGHFRPDHRQPGHLTHVTPDKTTGQICFTLAANLGTLGKDDAFLADTANYSVQSRNNLRLTVSRINPNDITGNNKRFLDGKTHLLTLTGPLSPGRDEITITLRNEYPAWVANASADSDTNPAAPRFATTTLGLDQFLRGLHDAFSDGKPYATITLRLDD